MPYIMCIAIIIIPYDQLFMQLRNLCVLAKNSQFADYAWFYMGCGYPTVDINYANYICAISVLFA